MKIIKKFLVIPQAISYFFLTTTAFAQSKITEWIGEVDEGVGSDLEAWLPKVLNYAIGLSAFVCVAIIISSGYMYITAGGDEEKIRKAGKSLTYAVVGLIICVISVILVRFVLVKFLEQ
ncbi:MAG: hypothetical protein WCX98_01070 [Candidatus Dojkabacteria bacterium]|jgi:hypothetical protein